MNQQVFRCELVEKIRRKQYLGRYMTVSVFKSDFQLFKTQNGAMYVEYAQNRLRLAGMFL